MATIEITADNFDTTIEGNRVVIVDFWAEWCGPCKAFAPIFEAAAAKHSDVAFAKCDVEQNEELAGRFAIQAIPTLHVYCEQVLVFAQPGMLPKAAFEELVDKVKELDMDEVRAEIEKQEKAEAN